MTDQPRLTIDGVSIPQLGFGTWNLTPEDARRMVGAALDIGYRHIDTAKIYSNEEAVGQAIRESAVPRGDIFLTTKIWVADFADGDLQRAAEEAVERLGTVPDLLLLHWPKPTPGFEETLGALNDAKARGFTRNIGLSNFPSAEWKRAQATSDARLITNQVEHHPYLSIKALKATAAELGSSITAWSPLAQGKVADDAVLTAIGAAHGKTAAQVTLRWLIQNGVIAIPRSSKESRAAESFAIFDFALSADDMARIDALARPDGRLGDWIDPAFKWDRD
ncbi:MAG: aldo/keto reductase [Pseudomonadota bacterium]